jgi:outer membrane receptor for ferrienterochelin and colicin
MGSNITNFQDNVPGAENKSKGIELATNWTDNKKLGIDFNYTLTKSYSGGDCDKPQRDLWGQTSCNASDNKFLKNAMVRVPIHAIGSKIKYQFNKNLKSSLRLTYKGQTRDYGGTDYSFKDQILDDYLLVDLASTYALSENYKIDFSLKNLFDKNHENSLDYSGTPRTMNIGLNMKY